MSEPETHRPETPVLEAQTASPSGHLVLLVLTLLVVVAAAEFVWRGPVRAMSSSNDIKALYLGARAWWDGQDPYGEMSLRRQWRESGGVQDSGVSSHIPVSVYPPPSHLVMAPISRLPWSWFKTVWMLGNVALFLVSMGVAVRLASPGRRPERWLLFAALALGLAPAHTAIAMGQVSIVCLALVLASESWAQEKGQEVSSGAALALAVALKPHVAGPFVICHFLRRRWKIGSIAFALTAVIALLSIVRLRAAGVEWLTPLLDNLALLREEGGVNDASATGALNYQHLNLHYLLYCFTDSRAFVQAAAAFFLLGCGAVGAWATGSLKPDEARPSIQTAYLSFWSVLMLLATYHRFYDAVFLVIPLAWVVITHRESGAGSRFVRAIALALVLVFLVPGASLLARGMNEGWLPAALGASWFGHLVVMPHQVWAMVILLLILLVVLGRGVGADRKESIHAALSAEQASDSDG